LLGQTSSSITRRMIIVTGGAGFIGSNVIAGLNERGRQDIILCDSLGSDDKWRNLNGKSIIDVLSPADLSSLMQSGSLGSYEGKIEAVFHLGANSSTVETDVDALLTENFRYSCDLWRTCASKGIRLIYASSAATYGNGSAGFTDGLDEELLATLRPLNAYGWTKHLFDQNVARWVQDPGSRPPQYAGLKFFNVYGPNEYHKGFMKSVVCEKYTMAHRDEPITLFKSYNEAYTDGGQLRDFIYVKDCVDVMLWLFDTPNVNGLFNVGTGQARSFGELAEALFSALGKEPKIKYIDMPEGVREHYQYFTQADITRLRSAGFRAPFTALEDGIADYVQTFLLQQDPYR
jgi:ADP-L-glycero-D-manno-heptose 6-epimerase